MGGVKRGLTLVGLLLVLVLRGQAALAQAPATTTVEDTVYRADGTPAGGTVLLSWPAFTTASGAAIAAGNTSVTLGTGGALTVALAPNAGSVPMGSYYTAVFHLNDGTTTKQYWVLPVSASGAPPVKLVAIGAQVLPLSVAMQTVTKAYVDTAIAQAALGYPLGAAPYVLRAGDTMTGPLVLPADPASANQAADKNYVDESVAAIGPRPPSGSAGGDLCGSYPNPTVCAGHIVSGTIDGAVIGASSPKQGSFAGVASGYTAVGVYDETGTSRGAISAVDGVSSPISTWPLGSALFEAATNSLILDAYDSGSAVKLQVNRADVLTVGASSVVSAQPVSAPSYSGPASAPSGGCSLNGAWVFSQDGHATVCASGSWVSKL